jgi:hypothetical protein
MGVEVYLYTFLTLVIDGGEQSTSCPDCFTPEGKQSLVLDEPQSWHGCFGKEASHQESNPILWPSSPQPYQPTYPGSLMKGKGKEENFTVLLCLLQIPHRLIQTSTYTSAPTIKSEAKPHYLSRHNNFNC